MDKGFYETVPFHELYDTQFDQATLATSDKMQMLFARTGNKVLYQKYYGNEKLEAVVDEIYDAMQSFHAE